MNTFLIVTLIIVSAVLVSSRTIDGTQNHESYTYLRPITIKNPCEARCLLGAIKVVKPNYPEHAEWFVKVELGLNQSIKEFEECQDDSKCVEEVRERGREATDKLTTEMIEKGGFGVLVSLLKKYRKCSC